MKDKKITIIGFLGVLCAAVMSGAVWYSLKFNGGRLVYPMDFGSYVFSYKDLPMILAGIMAIVYFAFVFFIFFGFYYEGKMSGTFMDEQFRENAARAQLKAYKIGFTINFIALIIFSQGYILKNAEYTLAALIILLSLSLALCIFLGEYLLYHYDNDENGI